MVGFFTIHRMFLASAAIACVLLVLPVYGQLNTPCTASSLATFTPCINFVTNSSVNGTSSPTSDCCNSLKSVVSDGTDCFCLIATGSVPFRVPINRTLALSLPRACNMPGVPLLCKASGAPIPAPGPFSSVPTPSPEVAPAPAPTASILPLPVSPSLAPEAETNPTLNPESPAVNSGVPSATNTGNRQSVTPSAAASSQSSSPMILFFMFGAIAFKNSYY